nr:KpsF/GutQ family sugar-phosphate isomerase [Novosphingobium sp. CF614]
MLTQARTSAVASAIKTLEIEQAALDAMRRAMTRSGLRDGFEQAVAMIGATQGRLIVTGMGKSGLIGRKIAATMTSTGTPSQFLHPGEASHGDLGMITQRDVVLALSWSGETTELGDIIAYCHRHRVTLIVATSSAESTAGKAADICLTLPGVREACPYELAPTSSAMLQLALGDALAVALIEIRGFTPSDFHALHPGGRLGAQLTTVAELMGVDDSIPRVTGDSSLIHATIEMSRKRYGCTAVVDRNGGLIGAFTDGDLRRCIAVHDLKDNIGAHMTPNPLAVPPTTLSSDALRLMNENAVSVLFVEERGKLVGIVHLHDVLGAGVA